VEHVLGFESGDMLVSQEYGIDVHAVEGFSRDGVTKFHCSEANDTSSAVRNWNGAATISNGDFLIAIADDLVPEEGWDIQLDMFISKIESENFVLSFTDDRCNALKTRNNDTLLPRHPLIPRRTYEQLGYLFNPRFDSVGPDFDLLVLSLTKGWLVDAREIKLHHSIGPIINSHGEVVCGCSTNALSQKRTDAQSRMHKNSEAAWDYLKADWGFLHILLGKIACINRLSDFVYRAMNPQRNNSPIRIIVKAISLYNLNKFVNPRLWR